MKKNEILKAVDSKKKSSSQSKAKTTSKKASTKKKNNKPKSNSTSTKKTNEVKNVTIQKIPEEKVLPKETTPPKEEYVYEEVIPFSKRIKILLMKILIVIVVLFGLLLLFLTLTEYRPEEREEVSVTGEVHRSLQIGESFSFLTWNVGYGALGEDADFFMDGGKKVKTADRNQVNHNIFSIRNKIEELSPTFFLLQEVDTSSTRDNHMNEYSSFKNYFTNYQSSFAYNFKVLYVPYPIPPIGNVNSGIATFSKFKVSSSERVQLPSSFIWPVSTANLKRCVLISRIPIENSDKELVIMNLHLEAYDKGKGKEEQTKALKKLLKAELKKGNYVIAGGDFNQVFSSLPKEKKKVKDGLWKPGVIDISSFDDGWLFYMDEKTPSCRSLDQPYKGADPEKFQYYYIDGYIVSNNISIESVETKDYSFANSDHNPVLIKGIINQ